MAKHTDVLFVYTNINGFHVDVYSFGIGYLSSVLKKNGFNTMLEVVKTKNDYKKVLKSVLEHKPKIIGFSSVSSQFVFVAELAEMIRKVHSCFIVCGGVHPTIFPDCLLSVPYFDGVFIGESEYSFLDFVLAITDARDYKAVDNFCYIDTNDKLIKNRLKPRIKNLEELPFPDRDIYDYQSIICENDGVASIMTNRGCPFDCTYCSNHAIARAYTEGRNTTRYNKIDNVFAEIDYLKFKYKFEKLWFEDDLFILNRRWLNDFLSNYKKRFDIPFMCHIRPDVCTREVMFNLKEAGCYKIFLAVESANDYIRNVIMKRNISKPQLENTFKWAKEAGIETLSVNIIGVPGDTEETILETIDFNRKMNPTIIGVNIYSPYAGTELGDYCRENNLIRKFNPFSFHDRKESTLNLPTITNSKLMRLYNQFHYLVYKDIDPQKAKRFLLQIWGARYRKLEKNILCGFIFKKIKKIAKLIGEKYLSYKIKHAFKNKSNFTDKNMNKSEQKNKIKNVYEFLSSINQIAYQDIFLLSNQVLSKNPFTNRFLMRYLKNERVQKQKFSFIFKKLLKYYFFSFKNFVKYLIDFIEYSFSKIRFNCQANNKQLILIDMPFLIPNIKRTHGFTDSYFPGLVDFLKKLNLQYAYLPEFVGIRKDFTMFGIFEILKKEKIPIITEYQVLTFFDLFYILHFIIAYPFHLFRFLRKLDDKNYQQNLLKSELIDTLNHITFISFSRYLLGKRITQLPYEKIKVISWDENQVGNKNLYKGLRKNSEKVKIYGAQLLIYSKNVLNIVTDEKENELGIVPDKIVVSGHWYIPKDTKLNYSVGPSLRFSKMFSTNVENLIKRNFLVLLPYYKDEIENILKILRNIKTWANPLFIKTHPAIEIKEFQHLLPQDAVLVNEDIYDLFRETKIMISGGASGTLIEAASLGIPTIFIKNPEKFDGNPLPDYGKGLIWDEATNSQELKEKINKFNEMLSFNLSAITDIGRFYKEKFFCKPSEENIIEAFDLITR